MSTVIIPPEMVDTFGKRVRLCRQLKGLRANTFAGTVGITRTYLSGLENGTHKLPSLPTLQRMAQALGVTTSQLLGETPL
mgnify:FL=1